MASLRVRRFWKSSVGADIVDAKYLMDSEEACSRNTFAATKISLCARSSYQGGVVEYSGSHVLSKLGEAYGQTD
jgi:hypothetical protein